MNLVLVGPIYPYRGGIAHYTTRLYQELIVQGHQVSLYSFKRQYPRWLFPGRTDRDLSMLKLEAEGEYKLDTLNPLTWLATGHKICLQQPDILILQWWVSFFAPIWMLLTWVVHRAGIRVIFICHNVLPHEQHFWDVWLARRVLGTGDGFVVQSQDEKDRLLALLPGQPVEVVSMPTFDMLANRAVSREEARQQLGLPEDTPVLLFFGFVREYKGLKHLLDAVPAIRTELAGIRLLVVGEFWQNKKSYLKQIEQLGIEQNVTIVDQYIPNEKVPTYLAAADVAVLPYTRVTQSAVVQLAFGAGLPVITTRVGGLSELVTEDTGMLVTPGDPSSLSDAICRYFKNDLGKQMRAKIKVTRPNFSWDRMIRVIEGLVQNG